MTDTSLVVQGNRAKRLAAAIFGAGGERHDHVPACRAGLWEVFCSCSGRWKSRPHRKVAAAYRELVTEHLVPELTGERPC